jgi:hypothetical protein
MEDLIKYRKRFNQPIVFNGLQDGVISPTDIDFCFEVDNKYLLIGEVKMKGKNITIGQKLVLQRIVDSWTKSGQGKLAIAYFVTHNTNASDDVVLADTDVESIYFNGQWRDKNIKFKQSVQILSEEWNINKLKNLK